MGSRILSRSFHVEEWESQDEDGENAEADISTGSGMDVDDEQLSVAVLASGLQPLDSHEGDNEDSDDEDQEDSSDIAMVPMADMLNARYGSENVRQLFILLLPCSLCRCYVQAKLFYEKNELKMISTKPIQAGEQIVSMPTYLLSSSSQYILQWNTYGDLPNADLLRRYGHVDLLPLLQGGEGNPGDVVDIRADLIVAVVSQQDSNPPLDSCKVKIDWWLENGGDE
jgi:SET domain-containing protein 6